jgi:hypothetical protein
MVHWFSGCQVKCVPNESSVVLTVRAQFNMQNGQYVNTYVCDFKARAVMEIGQSVLNLSTVSKWSLYLQNSIGGRLVIGHLMPS